MILNNSMFGISLDELKAKAEIALNLSAEKAAETIAQSKKKSKTIAKEIISVSESAVESFSNNVTLYSMDSDIKDGLNKVLNVAKGALDSANDMLNKKGIIMEHKIIMMGGRRSGKSTILSSILSQLRKNTPGTICTIIDNTDYTQAIETKNGTVPLPTLDIKQNEIKSYINKRQKNTEFLVDMSPTYGKASYVLEVSANNTAINLEFIDVPGEWMRANVLEYAQLVSHIEESDVFVIAIDTPFLMNAEEEINSVYNRVNEITQAMSKLKIGSPADLKQIILCPVKCEKWVKEGEFDKLVTKVKQAYRDLINRWVNCPEVTIQIMPIQTVGGLIFSRLLPAKLFFKDDNDPVGESCSEDPLTGLIINKEGKILRQTENSFVDDDTKWSIDYMDIPLSWYQLNGEGFNPKFCEQPGFHILKFLVEKEENVLKARAEEEQDTIRKRSWIINWLTKIFNPTFGQYLPVWKNVIDELSRGNYIKTEGDGFCYVREQIK